MWVEFLDINKVKYMQYTLGLRREDKNKWEKRVPIIPDHIKELKEKHNIDSIAQPSKIRTFKDKEYKKAGAKIQEDISDANVIFAVKEIPIELFEKNKTYIFFSHTIKGQQYNMPMLKKMMELKCNLIDYEKITDEKKRRLVFFGRYAGIAGMIDTLWGLGKKLKSKGKKTAFSEIKRTTEYANLEDAKNHIRYVGTKIKEEGFPKKMLPVIVGFAGYGHVSSGAQEILDILPVEEIAPVQLEKMDAHYSNNLIYKVVFQEKDMVEPKKEDKEFSLQEYYAKPELYQSIFHRYINKLTVLMNCIYWDERYPRLITKDYLEKNYSELSKLQIVGDISVDINGAVEFTEKVTDSSSPVFVYDPLTGKITDGYKGKGVAVMAVDNLPCELPKESSIAFSNALFNYIPSIVKTDYNKNFKDLNLPSEIKRAMILHHGKLTPDYQYINKFL